MTVSGQIRSGQIVLDEPLSLSEGVRVKVEVITQTESESTRQGGVVEW